MFWRSRNRRRISSKAGGYGLFFWRDPFWEPRVWLRRMVRIAVMLLLLAVVEAMKMENVLRAERDGTIAAIHADAGASLAVDEKILEFQAADG